MVDVHSPVNGVRNGGSPEQPETSRDGLRRMQRLSEAARVRSNPNVAAFHPLTSALVYPPANAKRHHVLASVFGDAPPRTLPLPPYFSPAQTIGISPDGAWLTAYHASGPTEHFGVGRGGAVSAGDLVIYGPSLLDPSTIQSTYLPLASFTLASPPLALIHIYPPRTRLGAGGSEAAPALGPAPPPGHAAARAQGPTLIVLTKDLLYFFHPHPLPATVVLDTRSSAAVPTDSVSAAVGGDAPPLQWTINALRCPLGARAYADLANPGPVAGNVHAQRGWLGMVGGNDGVWAAVERDGMTSVIRIDIGLDANNVPYMATTPLPALPRAPPPAFEDSSSSPEARLESVAFVPLKQNAEEGVGLVTVFKDADGPRVRTRFELCELRHRSVTVVDGFQEFGIDDSAATPSDWFASHQKTASLSPEGTTLLSLAPLPDVPPHTLALALVASPTGLVLAHVNLTPSSEANFDSGDGERWRALTGEEVVVDPRLAAAPDGAVALIPSQGALRGEMGLVGLFGPATRLMASPRLGADARPSETVKQVAQRAARSVELAVVQGVDWSDAVRAAFATVPLAESNDLAAGMLEQALSLFIKHSRSYVPHVLRLQVAVWALADDPRKMLAAELLRIGEASQVLYLCGDESGGVVSFDLDSVWNLVDVFECGLSILGATLRDAIAQRSQAEWAPSEPTVEGSSRVLYLVHPLLRRILARLIALLAAFAKFVTTLDRPIRPPEAALVNRSGPATSVAAERVQDALIREGIDLTLWGDVLGTLGKGPRPSDADTCASLLRLDIAPLGPLVAPALQSLPTPSSLFTCPAAMAAEPGSDPSATRDGATLAPIGDRPTALCDRCGARKVLAVNNVMRGNVPSPFTAWRRLWATSCMCGGSWMRQHLDARRG